MAKGLVEQSSLTAIADAIRAKGVEGNWKPAEMAGAITSIQGGGGSETINDPALKYSNAEEAYQDLRPAHWMPLMDMNEIMEAYPDKSVYMIGLARVKSNPTLKYGNSAGTQSVYVYVDGELVGSVEKRNLYNNPVTLNKATFKLNETDGYYEAIIVMVCEDSSQSPYWYSSNISGFTCFFDFDMYINLDTFSNNTNYYGNMGTTLSNVRFARLRTKVPNLVSFGTSGWNSESLEVVRRSDFNNGNSSSRSIKGPNMKYLNVYNNNSNPHITAYHGYIGTVVEYHDTSTNSKNTLTLGEYNYSGCIRKVIFHPNVGLGSVYLQSIPVLFEIRWDEATLKEKGGQYLISSAGTYTSTYGESPYIGDQLKEFEQSLINEGVTIETPSNSKNTIYAASILTFSKETIEEFTNKGYTFSFRNIVNEGVN